MEETGLGQYTKAIERFDGVKVNMQIKQKRINCKKRKVKTWTPEEDQQLTDLYNQHPKKWALISQLMNDRNQNQCLHRFRRLSQLGAHRKIWSPQQDQALKKLMKKIGKNWKVLSEMLGTKTGKQIRERFINKLDPKIKKQEWSDQQDRKIIELYSELGKKWSQISKHLPGRPQNKIKNRFYSYIQKNYDIKYRPIEEPSKSQRRIKSNQPKSLREITNRYQNGSISEIKEDKFFISNFPSINQMDLQLRMEDFPQAQQNRFSKGVVRSMVKIEEQWGRKEGQGYNQNEQGDNDLFYLSMN